MTMEEDQPVCEVTTQTKCDLTANQSKSIMSWSGVGVEQQTELQLIRKSERERENEIQTSLSIVLRYHILNNFLHYILTDFFFFSKYK